MEIMKHFGSTWEHHPGRVALVKRRIVLSQLDATSIHPTPYCAGPKQLELERKKVVKTRESDVEATEWALSILFVPKNDESLCFCVNHHRLNFSTEWDTYPIPRKIECTVSLGETQTFSTLDASSGHWQIVIGLKDIGMTVSVTY